MKWLILYGFLAVGLVAAAPSAEKDTNKLIIYAGPYLYDYIIYASEYEIINIVTPMNMLNYGRERYENAPKDSMEEFNIRFFFVEAKITDSGEKEHKGLYYFKNGNATKVLDNGVDVTIYKMDSTTVYIGATDGIYRYEAVENRIEKYGTIDYSIINISYRELANDFVILTADHLLYIISEEGTKAELIKEVKDAKNIVVDYFSNIYFFGLDNEPYMYTYNPTGIVKISGLPERPSYARFVYPPFMSSDAGILYKADNKLFAMRPNATSIEADFGIEFAFRPSAVSVQYMMANLVAYDKMIFQFNLTIPVLESLAKETALYLAENKDDLANHIHEGDNKL